MSAGAQEAPAPAPPTDKPAESAPAAESAPKADIGTTPDPEAAKKAEAPDAAYEDIVTAAVGEFDRGNWAEARALFRRAHDVQPSARTWRVLGMTAYELRRYVEALRELEQSLTDQRKPLDDEKRTQVTQLIERTKRFVGQYAVTMEPASGTLLVDGRPAELDDEGTLMLAVGDHSLRASADGYLAWDRTIRVEGGENTLLAVQLTQAPAPVAATPTLPPAPPPTQPQADQPDDEGGLMWTWVAGGATLAFAGAWAGLGLAANSEYSSLEDECSPNKCDESAGEGDTSTLDTLTTLTNVSIVLTGVAAATTVTLLIIESDSGSDSGSHAKLGVSPTGLVASGRF